MNERLCFASLRLCVMLVLSGSLATSAEPLSWRWAEGDQVRYQFTDVTRTTIDAGAGERNVTSRRADHVVTWTVEAIDGEGAATIRQSVERVVSRMERPQGEIVFYDSDDPEPPVGLATQVAPLAEALIEGEVLFSMQPSGEVTDVTLPDEVSEFLAGTRGDSLPAEAVVQIAKRGLPVFPDRELSAGDEWSVESTVETVEGPIGVTTTYRYDGAPDGGAVEALTPSVELDATGPDGEPAAFEIESTDSSGRIEFDREAGRLVRSTVEHTTRASLIEGDPRPTIEVIRVVEVRLLNDGEAPDLGDGS